jgi:hypothetical protein
MMIILLLMNTTSQHVVLHRFERDEWLDGVKNERRFHFLKIPSDSPMRQFTRCEEKCQIQK